MSCATRLVEIFGSQAEVARAFGLDRAVVNNWVKSGYVPARWATEVERVTNGGIHAVEVLNEASAKKPVKVKSRPEGHLFGSPLPGKEAMNDFAPAKRISSFHPPQRTLVGPGPRELHPRVLTTMSQPAIGYLDPVFVEMMEELKALLRYVYQTKNPLTFPLSGPGSVGMEYCFVNLVRPGDKVIVCKNGVFGARMIENVERMGGKAIVVEDEWGSPVDPQKLEDTLKKNRAARVVDYVKSRKDKIHSWFMDMNLLLGYWGATTRTYHHTAPTNSLFGLHEALLLIREEGLENAWARHQRHHNALKAGLEAMGLKFLVKEQYQLPQMNAVRCPEGVNEADVRKTLLNEFSLEMGAGLGPLAGKIWRIGIMGYSCRPDNVMLCLSALGSVLSDMGLPVHVGDAEAAAHGAYAQMHVKDAQRKKRAA